MRKKAIIITLTTLLILALGSAYFIYDYKKDRREMLEELLEPAKEHLESKYSETMVIEDSISYYDCYTLEAHPLENPDFKFSIYYYEDKDEFDDNYLERHAEWSVWQVIDSILSQYIENYDGHASISRLDDLEKLSYYYTQNNRPMSWSDEEHLEKIDYVHIQLLGYDGMIAGEILNKILKEIQALNFIVEDVSFVCCENEKEREPKLWQVFELKDGTYVLRE